MLQEVLPGSFTTRTHAAKLPVRRWPRRILMGGASLLLITAAAWVAGSQALLRGWAALTPLTVFVALLLGLSTTAAQSVRWYILAMHRGIDVGLPRALADCYTSSFGNMVLPGGLGGDAARVAVYRDGGHKRWTSPLLALGAE